MNKILIICLFFGIIIACSEGNDEPFFEEIIEEQEVGLRGDFVSVAHETSGVALVNNQKTKLSLTNFKTDSGPKLLVYLSTDADATEFISLGELKGTSGDFTYDIPANTDLQKYKIVNIWCVDFLVCFGYAELK